MTIYQHVESPPALSRPAARVYAAGMFEYVLNDTGSNIKPQL